MSSPESPDTSLWRLFERLVDLDITERQRLLDAEGGLNSADRRRLLAMLEVSAEAEARLDGVVGASLGRLGDEVGHSDSETTEVFGHLPRLAEPAKDLPAPIPRHLGPYRILKEIGRGGLSTVYLAEREEPQMKVAVKVVRPDMASDEMRERLRRERQILADLDHPNIARIFDGGTAENRAPYFVMELIEGSHIDEYCQDQELSIRRRLELFLKVAAAVDYAHRKLVLHRDLKPSNILVTEDGIPKLLDFGIAKLLQTREAEIPNAEITLTRPGMQVFTPDYASPEQILGEPLTTASDIYSLGVVLYQLVADEKPHTLAAYNAIEMARMATGPEPPPPSSHGRSRADDLDTIVLMTLRKDPERRYGSVAQLAEDIRRYLRGDAVTARKDTFGYRVSKFISRHKLAVASTLLVFFTLIGAVILTLWQAQEARLARERAERNLEAAELQSARAENVAGFLTRLFEVSDPYEARGRTISAREVLDQGARRIRTELTESPDLQAELMAVMGRVYTKLSLYSEAEELTGEALDLLQAREGPDSPGALVLRRDLAKILADRGECAAAGEMLRTIVTLESRRDPRSESLLSALEDLGEAEAECHRPGEAEDALGKALELSHRLFGKASVEAATVEQRIAQLWMAEGRYEQAIEILSEVVGKRREILGPDHLAVAEARSDLALAFHYNGRLEVAADIFLQALEEQRRILGNDHIQVATTLFNVAVLRRDQGEHALAESLFKEALEMARRIMESGHPLEADCLHDLSRLARRRGELDEAERLLRQALEIRQRLFGPESAEAAKSGLGLANLLAQKDPEAAKVAYLENIELRDRVFQPNDHQASYPRLRLGGLHLRLGELEPAEIYIRQAYEIRRAVLPAGHHEIALALAYLGQVLIEQGRYEPGLERLEQSLTIFTESLGEADRRTKKAVERLEKARRRAGDHLGDIRDG